MANKNSKKAALSTAGNKIKINGNDSYPAIGKLLYSISLKLESPLIIGCGEDEHSDLDVIRDAETGKPLIPATSLIGVFSSYLEKGLEKLIETDGQLKKNFHYLFGYRGIFADQTKDNKDENNPEQKREYQSALQCDDVILEKYGEPVLRDGVKIDPITNTAKNKSKYNYEVVEGDHDFIINLEITLRADCDKDVFKKLINTICLGIKSSDIRLGAKTNKGFGKLQLIKVDLAELDFKNGKDVYQWLAGKYNYSPVRISPSYEILNKKFKIDAWFKIKNSFLIKSYSDNPADPDAVHIKRDSEPVLPGTSVMGAIQHRARKIMNTIAKDKLPVNDLIENLFGFVREEKVIDEIPAQKGRVLVEETIINKENVAQEIQTRIKIDRFTGGTVSGALFEMIPLWQKSDHRVIHIIVTVKVDQNLTWAPGLFLLILKDLWTGDLPIGGEKNIGRGVLQGVSAEVFENNQKIAELKTDAKGAFADANNIAKLEPFVTTFWEVMNNGNTKR